MGLEKIIFKRSKEAKKRVQHMYMYFYTIMKIKTCKNKRAPRPIKQKANQGSIFKNLKWDQRRLKVKEVFGATLRCHSNGCQHPMWQYGPSPFMSTKKNPQNKTKEFPKVAFNHLNKNTLLFHKQNTPFFFFLFSLQHYFSNRLNYKLNPMV